MCEPYHSINQFEDQGPTSARLDTILGPLRNLGKRIRSWLHLSAAGAGHSEGMAKLLNRSDLSHYGTKYETAWWNRKTKIDGYYFGDLDHQDALIAAEQYAMSSSIGNIQILRRFLEPTLRITDRGPGYYCVFRDMLTLKGREELERKTKLIGGKAMVTEMSAYSWRSGMFLSPQLIKAMIGLTRKRSLLVPEWADDDKLWLPASKGSMLASV